MSSQILLGSHTIQGNVLYCLTHVSSQRIPIYLTRVPGRIQVSSIRVLPDGGLKKKAKTSQQ